MSEIAHPVSNDSNTPFMDEESPLKMRWSTLKKIVYACIGGAVLVTGWAINVKMTLSNQEDRAKRIEVRLESLEVSAKEQVNSMYEQKLNLRLIDQKLDNIASRQK